MAKSPMAGAAALLVLARVVLAVLVLAGGITVAGGEITVRSDSSASDGPIAMALPAAARDVSAIHQTDEDGMLPEPAERPSVPRASADAAKTHFAAACEGAGMKRTREPPAHSPQRLCRGRERGRTSILELRQDCSGKRCRVVTRLYGIGGW